MEQERQQRTSEELREGAGIPTNLPEMSAQQRVDGAAAAPAPAPEVFNIASEPDTQSQPDVPMDFAEPLQTRRRVRVRRGTQPMTVDDEVMMAAQTAGEKRQFETTYVNKQTKTRKAKLGTVLIRDFPKLINNSRMPINAIKQQMIMRDIAFEQDARKKI